MFQRLAEIFCVKMMSVYGVQAERCVRIKQGRIDMSHMRRSVAVVLVLVVSLLAASVAAAQEVTPSVSVSDQAIEDATVTVDSVVMGRAGL